MAVQLSVVEAYRLSPSDPGCTLAGGLGPTKIKPRLLWLSLMHVNVRSMPCLGCQDASRAGRVLLLVRWLLLHSHALAW